MLSIARRWWPHLALGLLMVGFAGVSVEAQFREGSFGGLGSPPRESMPIERPAPRVHYAPELSAAALKTQLLLTKEIALPFANETPLEDVLMHVRDLTIDDEHPNGLSIYVDPVGLLEADRTPQSPISINLDSVPIGRGLALLLRQVDLAYFVQDDGIVVITAVDGARNERYEPMPLLLDEVRALREEVAKLRYEVRTIKGQ